MIGEESQHNVPEDVLRIIAGNGFETAIDKLYVHKWVVTQAQYTCFWALPNDATDKLKNCFMEYARNAIAEKLYGTYARKGDDE